MNVHSMVASNKILYPYIGKFDWYFSKSVVDHDLDKCFLVRGFVVKGALGDDMLHEGGWMFDAFTFDLLLS